MKYKAIFLGLLIILAFSSTVHAATDEASLGDPKYFLEAINVMRRRYAMEYNVPDMHKLVWSEELVSILGNLDWEAASWPEARQSWRFDDLSSFELPNTNIEKDIDEFLAKDQAGRKAHLDTTSENAKSLEYVNPLQKFMGCGVKWRKEKTEAFGVCLIGPEGRPFTMFDVDGKDSNKLASECSEGYEELDGLCTPIDSSPISFFGSPDTYLDVVNALRREYAKEYNVPDMNELIWSDDLYTIAKSIHLNQLGSLVTNGLRYAQLHSFRSPADLVKRDLKWFIGKDANGRKEILDRHTIVYLELINPKQKLIACEGKWNDKKTEFWNLCLLALEEKAAMFDVDSKDPNKLASECSEGYEELDGLCTPIDKSKNSFYGSPDDYLDVVNALRRQYAKEYNVPDMHELVWNEDLVKILDGLNWDKTWAETRNFWRYAAVNTFHSLADNLKMQLNEFLAMDETQKQNAIQYVADKSADYLELLNPLQKTFGCTKQNGLFVACSLGPEGPKFTMFKVDSKDPNNLGSKCSEGYQNQDGLCTPLDRSTVSYYGSPDGYIDRVNALRRKYAKEYNVPDMHELVWSDDLVKILNGLNWADRWPESRITWRFAEVKTFHSPADNLEQELNAFLAKDEAARQKSINDVAKGTASYLEMLNPLQKTFGCTKKNDNVVVCSLGPEGPKFTMIDVNGKSNNTPGSKCSEGYQNQDGLCTPIDKSKVSQFGSVDDYLDIVNALRRQYAKDYNVPDMHALVWSDDLSTIAKNLNENALDETKTDSIVNKAWRFAKLFSFRSPAEFIERDLAWFLAKDENGRKEVLGRFTLTNLEFLNPKQKLMACEGTWNDKNTVFSVLCLLATEGKASIINVDGKANNVLGSECSENYQNQDGLCTPTDESKVSYLGSTEALLVEVNQLRRHYAKEYNVPGMHELAWSDDLMSIFSTLDWKALDSVAGKTWRYAMLPSLFNSPAANIEIDLKWFIGKDESGRKDILNRPSLVSLELLNPQQKFIACQGKWSDDKMVVYGLCLIGMEGQSAMLDVDGKSNNTVLGSKCSAGYVNIDGLCSIPPPPPPTSRPVQKPQNPPAKPAQPSPQKPEKQSQSSGVDPNALVLEESELNSKSPVFPQGVMVVIALIFFYLNLF